MQTKDFCLKSLFGGLVIGLGGLIYLSVDNKTLGALLFSIGLLSVCILGFNLFTGKVCDKNWLKNPLPLICIFLFNWIGAYLMAVLSYTHSAAAASLVQSKLQKPPLILLVDGIICGICIALAIKGYQKAEGMGKYLSVILGVMVFILCGSEHVVADMFYFALADFSSAHITIKEYLTTILLVGAGNTIGGSIFAWVNKK